MSTMLTSPAPPRAGRAGRVWSQARAFPAADPVAAAAVVVGLVLRVLYWQLTERRFEDGLITVAHARSVVEGIGLTHHAGEPVTHGFTTALSVLTPLAGELLGTFLPVMDGFLMLRLASLAAFVVTVLAASALCRRLGLNTWARAFVLLFLAVNYNQIFYGMAGMETQIGVAILLSAVLATVDRRVRLAGVLYGLCFLARPDFGLFVAPALLSLLLWNRRQALRAGAICLATVAPWIIFTTAYYGSPVPNTIKVKALRYHTDYPVTLDPARWWAFLETQVAARETWWHTFTPFLENGFVTETPVLTAFLGAIATVLVGLALCGMAVTRRVPGWWPALAFLGLYTAYRLIALPTGYYEWYYPPFMALVVLCAGAAMTRLAGLAPRTSGALAASLVALFAWPLPAMFVIDSRIQHDIENRVRLPLSLWIRDHVPPGASVTSESAGYVGYYGRPLLYDYPGLTSKRTLRVMENLGPQRNSMNHLINAARPDYVVFRPNELAALAEEFPAAAAQYAEVARFAVPFEESELTWGGTSYVNIDREFVIVQRRGAPGPRGL